MRSMSLLSDDAPIESWSYSGVVVVVYRALLRSRSEEPEILECGREASGMDHGA